MQVVWLILLGLFWATPTWAACNTAGVPILVAASPAQTDVSACYTVAANGNTIKIPAGSATWSSTLTVTKAVIFIGAGEGTPGNCNPTVNTCLTVNIGAGTQAFDVRPTADAPIRISGINFNLGTIQNGQRAIQVLMPYDGVSKLTQLRLDHLALFGGGATNANDEGGIFLRRWVWGVADHIQCLNVNECFEIWGDDTYAWDRARAAGDVRAGTVNAFFIEDSIFTLNSACNGLDWDATIYVQEGASVVVRHNVFDASACQNPNFLTMMYNNHGNFGPYINGTPTTGDARGMPIFESYNNTCHVYRFAGGQCMGFRGGSLIVHDETITVDNDSGAETIYVYEEEANETAVFPVLRTLWPAQDQIFNSFFWNITVNGVPMTTASASSCGGAVLCAPGPGRGTAAFTQNNRDFFMHAPQASGGRETFTGSRYGGSTTPPSPNDIGSMTFSSSGPNAYFPYTPYQYPHPLRGAGGDTTPPAAPTNLRVM